MLKVKIIAIRKQFKNNNTCIIIPTFQMGFCSVETYKLYNGGFFCGRYANIQRIHCSNHWDHEWKWQMSLVYCIIYIRQQLSSSNIAYD